jgi:hypothetical protein
MVGGTWRGHVAMPVKGNSCAPRMRFESLLACREYGYSLEYEESQISNFKAQANKTQRPHVHPRRSTINVKRNMQSLTLRRLAGSSRSTLSRATRQRFSNLAPASPTTPLGSGSRRLVVASSSLVLLVGLAAYLDGLNRPAWILKEVHADAKPVQVSEAELNTISKSHSSFLSSLHTFPQYTCKEDPSTDITFPIQLEPEPLKGSRLRLVGLGVRTVSFLSIRVRLPVNCCVTAWLYLRSRAIRFTPLVSICKMKP